MSEDYKRIGLPHPPLRRILVFLSTVFPWLILCLHSFKIFTAILLLYIIPLYVIGYLYIS